MTARRVGRPRTARKHWAGEYRFMREQGVSNRDVARQFEVQYSSLRRRCVRLGCWMPDRTERDVHQRLIRHRDSGQPFVLAAVGPVDLPVLRGLVAAEIRWGRLERIERGTYCGLAVAA